MAWRLDPSTDLILNMHLQPSGRPERIQPSIGLYFTDTPPTRVPMLLQLEHDGALDIPPATRAFTVTDELALPVDVQVLGLYPHAHYLGKIVEGTARLPDGTTRWLIRIPDWDLNWQAVYQLAEPLDLPKGTVLSMRWTYDNSSGNERNPNAPPQRVRAGNRSADEMAHLWVQVLPRQPSDRLALQEALMRARLREVSGRLRRARQSRRGAPSRRAASTRRSPTLAAAVQARPDHAAARNNLGAALLAAGRTDEAIAEFTRTLRSTSRLSRRRLQPRHRAARTQPSARGGRVPRAGGAGAAGRCAGARRARERAGPDRAVRRRHRDARRAPSDSGPTMRRRSSIWGCSRRGGAHRDGGHPALRVGAAPRSLECRNRRRAPRGTCAAPAPDAERAASSSGSAATTWSVPAIALGRRPACTDVRLRTSISQGRRRERPGGTRSIW